MSHHSSRRRYEDDDPFRDAPPSFDADDDLGVVAIDDDDDDFEHESFAVRKPGSSQYAHKQSNRPPSAPVQRSSSRPSSARPTSATSRPSSASLAHQLPPSSVPAMRGPSPLKNFYEDVSRTQKKRQVPANMYQDPETLYMENVNMKKNMRVMEEEVLKLRTKLTKTEGELAKKERMLEEAVSHDVDDDIQKTSSSSGMSMTLGSAGGSGAGQGAGGASMHLVKSLKMRVRMLEKSVTEKEEAMQKMKTDIRHTRVRELETELKAYYTESRRLQKIVDELSSQLRVVVSHQQSTVAEQTSTLRTTKEQEELIIRLREKNLHLRTLTKNLREDAGLMNNEIDRLHKECQDLKKKADGSVQTRNALQDEKNRADEAEARVVALQSVLRKTDDQLQEKEIEVIRIRESSNAEIGVLKNRIAELESAVAREKAEKTMISDELAVTKEKSTRFQARIKGLETEIEEIHKDSPASALKDERERADAAEARVQAISDTLNDTDRKLQDTEIELIRLREKHAGEVAELQEQIQQLEKGKSGSAALTNEERERAAAAESRLEALQNLLNESDRALQDKDVEFIRFKGQTEAETRLLTEKIAQLENNSRNAQG
eukprot:ANDGO_08223.mRNA.1 hypothetical protein TTHERM_00194430